MRSLKKKRMGRGPLLVALSLAFALGCHSEAVAPPPAEANVVTPRAETSPAVAQPAVSSTTPQTAESTKQTSPEPPPSLLPSKASLQRFNLAVSVGAQGAEWRMGYGGLPKNTRQVKEGYWIGSKPSSKDLEELYSRGVRLVLSGTQLEREERETCRALGMGRVNVPFGGRFPDHHVILEGTESYSSDEIFIHCEHGGDRSGALLAFLLVLREKWQMDQAILAVAFPGPNDMRRLIELLHHEGHEITENETNTYAGIYSASSNGGFGGLKLRGPSYKKLVRTTLKAMMEAQESQAQAIN